MKHESPNESGRAPRTATAHRRQPLRKGAPRSVAGPGSNAQTPICSAHAGKGVRTTPRDPALRPRPPTWTGRGRLLSGHVSTADLPQPPVDTVITPSFEFPLFPDKIVFKKAKLQTRVTRPEMVKGGAQEPACPGRPAPDVTQPHVHRSACVSRRKMSPRPAGPGPSTYLARGLRVVAKGPPGSRAWGSGRCCGHWVCVSKPGSEQRDPDPAPRCCFPARCGPDAGPCSQTPTAVPGTESGSLPCAASTAPRFCSKGHHGHPRRSATSSREP